jgi:cell division protein FtsQ
MTSIDERTNTSHPGPGVDRADPSPIPQRRRSMRFRPWRRIPRARFRLRRRGRRTNADTWLARQQRRRRLRLVLAGIVVVAVGCSVWLVAFSSWFSVREIRVEGLSTEAQFAGIAQVEQAAAVPLGDPLLGVDIASAQSRVAQLPWIESTQVYRSWPNAVVIDVVERSPVAVVEQGDARRGVDATGVLFDPPGGLWLTDPVIRGEEAAMPEAVAVVASLPEEIQRRLRIVQAVSPDDIRLQLGNDAIVRWGNAENAAFKAEVLLSLLPRRAQAYDVSAPQLPTTFGERGPRN